MIVDLPPRPVSSSDRNLSVIKIKKIKIKNTWQLEHHGGVRDKPEEPISLPTIGFASGDNACRTRTMMITFNIV